MEKRSSSTLMCAVSSVMSTALALLVLSSLVSIVDSYPNINKPNTGCEKCVMVKNEFYSDPIPVYECKGCCSSRAFPTSQSTMRSMSTSKNITSEATCCVAGHSNPTYFRNTMINNHTFCHCSTCYHNKA